MPSVQLAKLRLVDAGSVERSQLGEQLHAVGRTDDVQDSSWRRTGVAIGVRGAAWDEHVVTSPHNHDLLAESYLVPSLQNDKRFLVPGVQVVADTRLASLMTTLDEGIAGLVTGLIEDLQSRPRRRAEGNSAG